MHYIFLPPIFNDWFTFISAKHSDQTSSSAKEKLLKPPFKTISYGNNSVIGSSCAVMRSPSLVDYTLLINILFCNYTLV